VVQPLEQQRRRQDAAASGGQLDGQGQAVKPQANIRNDSRAQCREVKTSYRLVRPLGEQLH
jgi:hypothetical protein